MTTALSIIQATVEPSTDSHDLTVLRAACRRHGLPAPRPRPARDNRYAQTSRQPVVYAFGPHNIFEFIPSRIESDNTIHSYPCITVLCDGGDDEAAILVVSPIHDTLEHVLDEILSPKDPAHIVPAISRLASSRSVDLRSRIEQAFQAHATVEPGHDIAARLKRLGFEQSPWASTHHGFHTMHSRRVGDEVLDSIVFGVESVTASGFYIYFCGYQVQFSTTQHLIRDVTQAMYDIKNRALSTRSLKEFTAWLVSTYKCGFRSTTVAPYFKAVRTATRIQATVEPTAPSFPQLLRRLQAANLVPHEPTHRGQTVEYMNTVITGPAGYGYRSTYVIYKDLGRMGQVLQFCLFDHPVMLHAIPVLHVVPVISRILKAIGHRDTDSLTSGIQALKLCIPDASAIRSLDPVRSVKVMTALPDADVLEVQRRYP